jgi:anti-sigma factor RsiW
MNHITDDELIDYLHDEVDDAVGARLHAHMAVCRACAERYDAEASLTEMLRAAVTADEREMPSIVKARVWAKIRDAQPSLLDRIRAFVTPAVAVPLAAALALLMYLGVPVIRGDRATGSPTVAAAYYFEEHAALGLENPLADHVNTNAALAYGNNGAAASSAPLIDAAAAATPDDVAVARE